MKSKIVLSLVALSLLLFSMVSVVAPPIPPYVIAGQMSLEDGSCVSGFDIKAKAFSFSEFVYKEVEIPVNEECEYSLVLGNAPFDNWNEGMKIDLTFCDTSKNPSCLKSITIGQGGCEAGGGCRVDFRYASTDYTPAGEPITQYIEKEIVKEVVKVKCSDGTLVDNEYECLETKKQVDDYLYAVYGLGAAAIGYLVSYFVRKGKRSRGKKMIDTYGSKRRKK